jgi:membrane protease YdiL (CAAX protease family)
VRPAEPPEPDVVFACQECDKEITYLIPRLERLLGSTVAAVGLTAVMFGSYHVYQGVGPAISVAGVGVVFGISFCLLRRLWPLCLAHALQNFLFAM